MADVTDDAEKIERDLAATRARMDRRLDELGDRLAPNQLVSDTLTQVTGGDGVAFARTLIAKARANPIAAALAGIGGAWLMASDRHESDRAEPDLSTRLRSAERAVVRMRDEHADIHASRIDDARGQVLGIARDASDTAASYGERIRDAMASATRSLHEVAQGSGDGVAAGDRVARERNTLVGNPVLIGGVAALVGLVAGALIPVSEQERRALGSTAGRLRTQGRGLAQEVVDGGARVAGDVIGAVQDSAKAHGLTADRPIGELVGDLRSGELAGHVRQAAREVADVGAESVSSQLRADEAAQG